MIFNKFYGKQRIGAPVALRALCFYYGGRTVKVKIPATKLLTSVETSVIMNKKTLIFWAAHSKKIGYPTNEYP